MHAEARTHFLTFLAGGEEYGVEVLDVREILELGAVSRLPAKDPALRCVVKVDGWTLPVLDLGALLGFPPAPLTERTSVVVVEREWRGGRIGILAEALRQVVDLATDSLRPAPAFGAVARAGHVAAMAGAGRSAVSILDVQALMRRAGQAGAPATPASAADLGLVAAVA